MEAKTGKNQVNNDHAFLWSLFEKGILNIHDRLDAAGEDVKGWKRDNPGKYTKEDFITRNTPKRGDKFGISFKAEYTMIDIDSKALKPHENEKLFRYLDTHPLFTKTYQVRSESGGRHYVFKYPVEKSIGGGHIQDTLNHTIIDIPPRIKNEKGKDVEKGYIDLVWNLGFSPNYKIINAVEPIEVNDEEYKSLGLTRLKDLSPAFEGTPPAPDELELALVENIFDWLPGAREKYRYPGFRMNPPYRESRHDNILSVNVKQCVFNDFGENEIKGRLSELCHLVTGLSYNEIKDKYNPIIAPFQAIEDAPEIVESETPKVKKEIPLLSLDDCGAGELQTQECPEISWLVRDLLPAEGTALLFGAPKSKKSFLLLNVVKNVYAGTPFLNRETTGRTDKIIYVSFEDNLRRAKERTKLLEITDNNFKYLHAGKIRQLKAGGVKNRDLLHGLIKQHRPRVVLLDTLGKYLSDTDTDINSYKDIDARVGFLSELSEKYNCLIVCVHHTRKQGKDGTTPDDFESANGSQALLGCFDTLLLLQKNEGDFSTLNAQGKDVFLSKPIGLTIDGVAFSMSGKDHPSFKKGDSLEVDSEVFCDLDTPAKNTKEKTAKGKSKKRILEG